MVGNWGPIWSDIDRIVEMVEVIFGPVDHLCEINEVDMGAIEESRGFPLPAALECFYHRLGCHPLLTESVYVLLPPADIHRQKDRQRDAMVFMKDSGDNIFWGVMESDLTEVDPPVHLTFYNDDTWAVESERTTAYLAGQTAHLGIIGASVKGRAHPIDELYDPLRKDLTLVTDDTGDDRSVFLGPSLVACWDRQADFIGVATRTEEDLVKFEHKYGIELERLRD